MLARTINFFLVIFFTSLLVIPRSYGSYKLVVLVFLLFLISTFFILNFKRLPNINLFFLVYFLVVILGACIWSIIGVLNGSEAKAIFDYLRLFLVFSIVYFVLYYYLTIMYSCRWSDAVIVASSIFISIILFFSILNSLFSWSIIPHSVIDELNLKVGIHEGYTHVLNHNIGMMSFLISYTLSLLFLNSKSSKLILYFTFLISFLAVVLSSRRAVLFVIILVPAVILFFSYISNFKFSCCFRNFYIFYTSLFVAVILFVIYLFVNFPLIFESFVLRITEAFNEDYASPRVIQKYHLLSGFYNNWLLGSGFGGTVEYVRDDDRPWIFELSYHVFLFNVGLFAFTAFALVVIVYLFKAILNIRKNSLSDEIKIRVIALMVAYISVLLISYTNPYMTSSFDFMFTIFLPPLIVVLSSKAVVDSGK